MPQRRPRRRMRGMEASAACRRQRGRSPRGVTTARRGPREVQIRGGPPAMQNPRLEAQRAAARGLWQRASRGIRAWLPKAACRRLPSAPRSARAPRQTRRARRRQASACPVGTASRWTARRRRAGRRRPARHAVPRWLRPGARATSARRQQGMTLVRMLRRWTRGRGTAPRRGPPGPTGARARGARSAGAGVRARPRARARRCQASGCARRGAPTAPCARGSPATCATSGVCCPPATRWDPRAALASRGPAGFAALSYAPARLNQAVLSSRSERTRVA